MRRLLVLLPILLLAGVHLAVAGAMADGLNVDWRQAKVVRLAKPASSIIVGDPTVVDVTLDDPRTLIVFGKTPGETNMIVLTASQELLLDWPVVVTPLNTGHVSVLNSSTTPSSEVLYSCGTERCARVLSPTDIQFKATSNSTTNSNSDASKSSSSSQEPTISNGQGSGAAAGAPAQPAAQ